MEDRTADVQIIQRSSFNADLFCAVPSPGTQKQSRQLTAGQDGRSSTTWTSGQACVCVRCVRLVSGCPRETAVSQPA